MASENVWILAGVVGVSREYAYHGDPDCPLLRGKRAALRRGDKDSLAALGHRPCMACACPIVPFAPPDTPAEVLRTVRRLKGLTQQGMADALGYASKMTIWHAEQGRRMIRPAARLQVAEWVDELKAEGKWEAPS